jgi:hypothetical protein
MWFWMVVVTRGMGGLLFLWLTLAAIARIRKAER